MLKYMLSNLLDIGISMYDFLLRIANAHYQVVANLNKTERSSVDKVSCGGTCQFKFKFFKFNIGAHIFFGLF